MAQLTNNSEHDHDNNNVKQLIIKNGYLKKQSAHLHLYRKRWIVLVENKIYSYKDKENMVKATEIFDLTIYDIVKTCNKSFEFILSSSTDSKNYKNRLFLAKTTILNQRF